MSLKFLSSLLSACLVVMQLFSVALAANISSQMNLPQTQLNRQQTPPTQSNVFGQQQTKPPQIAPSGYALKVYSITQTAPIYVGDKYGSTGILKITIKNIGLQQAPPSNVTISMTTDSGSANPLPSGKVYCPSLQSGAVYTIDWPSAANIVWFPGNYRLTAQVRSVQPSGMAILADDSGFYDFYVSSWGRGAVMIWDDDAQHLLSGATVTLTGNGTTKTVLSVTSGLADFGNLRPGNYTFTVSKSNYTTASGSMVIKDGRGAQPAVVLRLLRGNVAITVTDGQKPLQGIAVTGGMNNSPISRSWGKNQTVVTNAQGVATFNDLVFGNYGYSASPADYKTNGASVAVSKEGTSIATIIMNRKTATASITVRDVFNSHNIVGATVTVKAEGKDYTQITNENGFAFFNLPTGKWSFTASMNTFTSKSAELTIPESGAGAIISLSKLVSVVNVTVTDGANVVSDADVTLFSGSGSGGISQRTDSKGKATFARVLPGQYMLESSRFDYNTGKSQVFGVTENSNLSQSVSLTKKQTIISNSITVSNNFGELQIGANVTLSGNGISKSQLTGSDGRTTFTDLQIGVYSLTINKTGYKAYIQSSMPIMTKNMNWSITLSM